MRHSTRDVTPGHVRIGNEDVKHLWSLDALAAATLGRLIADSENYGTTLTDLIEEAGTYGPRASYIRRSFHLLVAERHVCQVIYTYEQPPGDSRPANAWMTQQVISSVKLSDDYFTELVDEYTPGNYVPVLIASGRIDRKGHEIYDVVNCRVKTATLYWHQGVATIDRNGALAPQPGDKRDKRPAERRTTQRSQPARKGKLSTSNGVDETRPPDFDISKSGVTRENDASSQVAPDFDPRESGGSKSFYKTNHKTKPNQAGALAPLGCRTDEPSADAPGSSVTKEDDQPALVVADQKELVGNPPPAHACETGPRGTPTNQEGKASNDQEIPRRGRGAATAGRPADQLGRPGRVQAGHAAAVPGGPVDGTRSDRQEPAAEAAGESAPAPQTRPPNQPGGAQRR